MTPSPRALAWVLSGLIVGAFACRAPAPVELEPPGVDTPQAEGDAPAPEAAIEPALHLTITPVLVPSPRVEVRLEWFGPAEPDEELRSWSLAGPLAGPVMPSFHDAEGPIEISATQTIIGVRLELELERAPVLPLRVEYSLAPGAAPRGSFARLELDDSYMFATGEALLLLPDDALDRRLALKLELDPSVLGPEDPSEVTGLPPLRAATTFGAHSTHTFEGGVFELRRAAVIMGQLEWARFDSMAGEDRWLGAGVTRFDHRWSAAELAGVRGAVDAKIGMPTLEPQVTLLLGGPRAPSEPAFRAQLRGRGLVILADEGAIWSTQARMEATQALVARWLGGRVRVRLDPEADALGELWFKGGATRYLAREVLYELGLFDDEEYLAELNRLEVELATSPLRERPLDALVALIAAGAERKADPSARQLGADAQALLVARGATFMAWLDANIRASGSSFSRYGVDEALRMLVAHAVADQRRELPLSALLHEAAHQIDADHPPEKELGEAFKLSVLEGERLTLGADTFGPCFRPRTRKLRRFELGFVDTTPAGGARPRFAALDPAGPAAKAGLREDDELFVLDYLHGDAEREVELSVRRAGTIVELRYAPAGPSARGVQWERDPRVSELECLML